MPEPAYIVRMPTFDDAANVLTLYERHFGPYTGSFERSIEQQVHWMQYLEQGKLWLAIDTAGQAQAYLFLAATQTRRPFFLAGTQVWEMVADNWQAGVALLQHHMQLVEKQQAAEDFLYSVPPNSAVVRWMMEKLEVTDISTWDNPVFDWSVRMQSFHHRNAGWMAWIVSLSALVRAMWRH